jgi:hypothetical protein
MDFMPRRLAALAPTPVLLRKPTLPCFAKEGERTPSYRAAMGGSTMRSIGGVGRRGSHRC